MFGKKLPAPGSLRALLRAVLIWLVAAFVLLLAASGILARAGTGSEILGYISSGISFLCAVAAGAEAARCAKSRPLLIGLLSAGVLVILLLTVGFMVRGETMDASGILSVVTFTAAGCILGSVVFGQRRSGKKGKRFFTGKSSAKKFT